MFLRVYNPPDDQLPARISVPHAPDKPIHEIGVVCEVSANGKWGNRADWQPASAADTDAILAKANLVLVKRHQQVREASGAPRSTRMTIPLGGGESYFFSIGGDDDLCQSLARSGTGLQKHIVKYLLREEVGFREAVGLKPAARFEDLIAVLKKTRQGIGQITERLRTVHRVIAKDTGIKTMIVRRTGPWTNGDIVAYLNQGIAYIDGDLIMKNECAPSPAEKMATIVKRRDDLTRLSWTLDSRKETANPFASETLPEGEVRLVAVNHHAQELTFETTGAWHLFDVEMYLNMGIAHVEGNRIFKRGIAPDYRRQEMAIVLSSSNLPAYYSWVKASELGK